ncbi:MAG: GTPase Era [Oscillospiraceae bacterium]|nr:GTPase Era [Oscillospiraceae bacterium]
MITICGRPNVGKSTLANTLAGEKIAIVSDKPQTTRSRITAICQRGETQCVFMDTPGFHKPRTRLGEYMVGVVRQSVADVDAAVLVVEPVPALGPQERELIRALKAAGVPAVLAVNKIDTVEPQALLAVIAEYAAAFEFAAVVPVSARTGEGVEELLTELDAFSLPSEALFEEGATTDQPEKQVCAELIREKLLKELDREVPHGTAVEITRFSERDNGIIDLEATIYCEKASHKGIIIGRHGAMLKKVGEEAREDIERFMGTKVYLQTWVKVKENWRDSQSMLRNFGFTDS